MSERLRRLSENRARSGSDPLAAMKAQNRHLHEARKPKKQSSITSFIYKDPAATTTATSTPDKAKQKRSDKEVQASLSIVDHLCSDDIAEDYWKELAIEREKALNDTLEENRSLCELIQVRTAEKEEIEEVLDQITKENGLLKEKADRADVLAEVIQELMPDDE